MSELITNNLENAVVDTEISQQNCTNNNETYLDNTPDNHETIHEAASSVQAQSVENDKTLGEKQSSDCLFRENEPKHENGKVGAHRVVLASVSPLLKMLLSRRNAGEVATIVLPDVSVETILSILQLCYTGTMAILSNNEGSNEVIRSAMDALRIGFPDKNFSICKSIPETPPTPIVKEGPELNVPGVDAENHEDQLHAPLSVPEIAVNGKQELIEKNYPQTCIKDDTTASTTLPRPKSTTTNRGRRGRPRCTVAKPTPSVGSSGSKRGRKPNVASRRNVKKEKSKDVSKADKDIKHTTVEGIESPLYENGQDEEIKAFTGIFLSSIKDDYVCLECKGIIETQREFRKHLQIMHASTLNSTEVSSEEIKNLVKCDICNRKRSGVQGASECLEEHGFVKCFTCFGVILKADLYEHYTTVHGVYTTFARVANCRWCNLAIAIGDDGQLPQDHATSAHIQPFLNSNPEYLQVGQIEEESNSSSSSDDSDEESNLKENSEKSLSTPSQDIKGHETNPIMKRNYDQEETHDEAPSPKKRKLDDQGNPLQLSKRTGAPSWKSSQRTFLEKSTNITTQPPAFTTATTSGKIIDLDISKLNAPKICLDIMNEGKVRKLSDLQEDDSDSTLSDTDNNAI
ncbi:uncharacterized protein LOC110850758 isoform X3 [Folsomia candida]|uniref:uncharacterized protein LOC110850758 isoform X3 n=1 Tax=Folsomia candida TaxID=158441 RepID=UPI000B8F3E29|nr:uncharacterized protein LOC110850758 isoform X3 [Folsomia candida]